MAVSAEEAFRRLTIGCVTQSEPSGGRPGTASPWHLDARTEALLQLAALVALDAPQAAYRGAVEAAQRTGSRLEDLAALLFALTETVGTARIVAAAPKIALAAGYDVDAALE